MDFRVALPAQLRQLMRSLRKRRGLTQSDLAQRLGVGQSRVAAIERDPGAVSVEKLLEVLTLLDAQFLVRTGDGPSSGPPPSKAPEASEVTTALPNPARQLHPPSTERRASDDSDEPRGEW
jgi:HTH-type transcriptional regulator/antitoxin HipB